VWGYGTSDPLEEVLAPNYFALARTLLRPGELIYVNVRPRQRRGSEAEAGVNAERTFLKSAEVNFPMWWASVIRCWRERGLWVWVAGRGDGVPVRAAAG
jgi:hypothetical protein